MQPLARSALETLPMLQVVRAAEAAFLAHARGAAPPPVAEVPAALAALAAGAAAAAASKHLAVAAPRSLGLVGCNEPGRQMLRAHQAVFPSLELNLADAEPEVAARLAAELGCRAGSAEEAAACDIVCVAAAEPVVRAAWIADGTHVNVAAGIAPDPALWARAVVTADRPGGGRPGLGQVVAGESAGRLELEVTLFAWDELPAIAAALAELARGAAEARQ